MYTLPMQRVRLETSEPFHKYMSKRYGLELSSPLDQLQYCFEGWSEVLKQYVALTKTTLTYIVVLFGSNPDAWHR